MAIPFSFSQKRNFTLPYPEDFAIFVDGKQHLFYSEKLAVFSPKINQLFICDPTLKSIEFPYKDEKNQFSSIETLVNGGEIVINKDNCDFLSKAATFFENEKLLSSISIFLISSSGTNIFSRLSNNHPIKFIQKELEYIAKEFQSFIENDDICSFPLEYYDAIFNSPSFNFSNDHDLFKWITKMVKKYKSNFVPLYSHINFDNLTPEEIQEFLKNVDISKLNGSLLYSVKSRLTKTEFQNEEADIQYTDKVVEVPPYLQIQSKEFPFVNNGSNESRFEGIFNYISQDGNPQFRGYITMDTGSPRKKKHLHRIINSNEEQDYNWNNYDGISYKKEDQWIIIRFFIYKIRLDAYTFYINKDRSYFSQMKHWKIYGSENGIDWKLLDERDTDVLNKPHSMDTFYCNKGNKNFYSYFKIEQLENFSNTKETTYEMTLTRIELFGEVQKL